MGLGATIGPGGEGVGLFGLRLRRHRADGVTRPDDDRTGEGRCGRLLTTSWSPPGVVWNVKVTVRGSGRKVLVLVRPPESVAVS
jgi:hypothetical protein